MLQIMELLRCFTAYEKDDKVKLLIMKVPDTTVFLLSFIVDVIKLGIYIYVYVLFSALVIWAHYLGAFYSGVGPGFEI